MTNGAKGILKKDFKKYTLLAEYADDTENKEVFQKIALFIAKMMDE